MRPYVETALRTPLLWIIPVVLIPLLVAVGALLTSRQYEVTATVWAQAPSLIDTTTSRTDPPAQIEAQTFNERLSTEAFRNSVITAAGLDDKVASGEWPSSSGIGNILSSFPLTKPFAGLLGGRASSGADGSRAAGLAEVETALRVEARGNNLVLVKYAGGDGEVGVALVNAAIQTYQKENQGQTSTQAQSLLAFYEEQVTARQQELEEADANLRAFEAEHPIALGAPRVASEAQKLAQLQSIYNIRLSQYELALDRQSEADVRAQASLTTSNNAFELMDAPRLPDGPVLNFSRAAMLTFLGTVFGVGLGSLLIALRTWSDQRVRRREDVSEMLEMNLLAALPDLGKGGD